MNTVNRLTNVLVVEDEVDSLELIQGLLQYHGIGSTGVLNANDALVSLREHVPDMIIIDLALPDIDGWTLLERLREDAALQAVPKVAMTAYHNPTLAQKAVRAGFDAYFAKPIDATTFVQDLQDIRNN